MDILKLQSRINDEVNNKVEASNLAQALCDSPEDFQKVVGGWMNGQETDYCFNGITLKMICEKEQCTYLHALLRMQLFFHNPMLTSGYKQWTPINKDWRR